MQTFRLAWRNIWRNKRRTSVTVAAMAVAVLVTTVYSSMVTGYLGNMERDALDLEVGAAEIFAAGYQDKPSVFTAMPDSAAVVRALDAQGIAASERLLAAGLASAGEASAGVTFRGLNVEQDARVLTIGRQVREGEWLDPADPRGVVVGSRLAKTLGVKVGSEIVMLGQATDGSIANELGVVRGILRSVGEATDRSGIFMTQDAFRGFMAYAGGAHQIIIQRQPQVTLELLEPRLEAVAPRHDVQTWRELMPMLGTMLDSTKGLMAFMSLIVNIAIAIVVLNAMLMAVFERIKEFGILKALGAGALDVLKLIYAESMMQVGLAVAAAAVLAVPSLWYLSVVGIDMGALAGVSAMGLSMGSSWQAVVTPATLITPVTMTVAVVTLAVLYPALKAALIEPVRAIHHT